MEPQTLSLRRFKCVRRIAKRYSPLDFLSSFVLFSINNEPICVKEALNSKEGKIWKKDMVEEVEASYINEAWVFVEFLDGSKYIGSKWEFKKKPNIVGKAKKYKARLVAKGYSSVK